MKNVVLLSDQYWCIQTLDTCRYMSFLYQLKLNVQVPHLFTKETLILFALQVTNTHLILSQSVSHLPHFLRVKTWPLGHHNAIVHANFHPLNNGHVTVFFFFPSMYICLHSQCRISTFVVVWLFRSVSGCPSPPSSLILPFLSSPLASLLFSSSLSSSPQGDILTSCRLQD